MTTPHAPKASAADNIDRVLIVDDDADFAAAITELLVAQGYAVRTAHDAAEALAAMGEFRADVALLDLRLGADSGLESICRLRAQQPELLCIIITAYPEMGTSVTALREGAYDYLRKPLNPTELLAALRRSFDRLHLMQENANLERQLRQIGKQEAIARLAGGVAHDFNNVLTTIMGNVELLLTERKGEVPLPPRFREGLRAIEHAAERAAALTRQLLLFSQHRPPEADLLDVNASIENAAPTLRARCHEGVELTMNLAESLPLVRLAPGVLEQALNNLVTNACDALAGRGRVEITTTTAALDPVQAAAFSAVPAVQYVVVAVADSGCGMDTTTAERVFEPFFTTKPECAAHGVGLAEVYGRMRQANGWVTVTTAFGAGSVFRMYLPVLPVPAKVSAESAPDKPALPATDAVATILLCEDEAPLRTLVVRMLERGGFRVLAADCGASALALADAHDGPIDLLLTDIRMPGMDGRELARRLSERRPTTRVVFTSGYAADVERFGGDVDGRTLFVQKPYSLQALVEQLRAILRRDN